SGCRMHPRQKTTKRCYRGTAHRKCHGKRKPYLIVGVLGGSLTYEGDYGSCISDRDLILSDVEASHRDGVPDDYLEFLEQFGFGDLDSALYIEDGPVKYAAIAKCEVDAYRHLYVFAGSGSGVLYAFDAENDWAIVEIDPELDGATVLFEDFSSFILSQLAAVKGYVDWRAAQ
uniref:SMI1/KNR4 family protein n=1 Tax=unclassified Pseudomonas TaxID=196821 RepID=UPI0030DCDB24